MEVTKSNFAELRPEIEEAIKSCSFMAVDGEFTGLNNGSNISPFDTPAQYYTKILSGSLDFLFVQFGLSVFRHLSDFKYENKTYIFYLFPDPLNRDAPDCRFLCQTSSLSFLAKHGFDFNKLIREGIPYLKQPDEDTLREAMEGRRKIREACAASPSHIEIPPAQKPLVDQVITQIKELLDPDSDKSEVRVEKCSAFVRKLVYQTVREELSNTGITVETDKGVLVARKGVDKEQLDKEKQKKADEEEFEIQNAVGFVSIIKSIMNSGKLMVGHNFLLDLCHMVHQFVDYLPQDYFEFKDMVNSLFPKIIDTKFLCSEGPLKDLFPSTFLQSVLETVSKPPFQLPEIVVPRIGLWPESLSRTYLASIRFFCRDMKPFEVTYIDVGEENQSFQLSSEKYHDAGYDAFVTGICFLSALRYLQSDDDKSHNINSSVLAKTINRLYLMRIPDTCINLGGQDPEPLREHVFHVTFPKTWTSQHLQELFSPFGTIQISWISDTTAWVGLHDRREADRAKKLLETKSPKLPGVSVSSYDRFQASFKSPAALPTSSSSVSSSPPRSTKRKLVGGSGQRQETDDTAYHRNKKHRSSRPNHLEAAGVHNGKAPEINTLETASKESSSQHFPVDDNWD